MPWCYIDDGFPEHPKVLLAGGDAGWLWLCGYAYVNRNLTDGWIPKAVIPRISDRKNPQKLAKTLVSVGLWEDDGGDAYYMHDYDQFNQTAKEHLQKKQERSERARRAATARWGNGNADAMHDASTEHAVSNVQAVLHAYANGMLGDAPPPQPHPQPPTPLVTSLSTNGCSDERTGSGRQTSDKPQALVDVVASSCSGNQRDFVKAEAEVVVTHLTRYVDRKLVEEAASQARQAKANLPRWLLPVVRSKAESYGIAIPTHELEQRTSA